MKKLMFLALLLTALCLLHPILLYSQSVDTAWIRRYNGPGRFDDQARDIAVDTYNNVYVTGYSVYGGSEDIVTIKYNTNGDMQWLANYNGPGNSVDEANAITLDGSGNVYVTGASYGSGTGRDIVTIKYNTSGNEQWVARYNGPGNGEDEASAIITDDSGNVYISGGSFSSGGNYDFVTIKYNTSGVQQWVSRYIRPPNNYVTPMAIAIDNQRDVCVTGFTFYQSTNGDYTTIKYNSLGETLWTRRYNDSINSVDVPNGIAVDAHDNIYVTGYMFGSHDYATVKYNPDGVQEWVARYGTSGNQADYATSITVDGENNIIVTGSSAGDYATIKYDSTGFPIWVARYNGPGIYDNATSLLADAQNNIYVTGYSEISDSTAVCLTIKYNPSGIQQWAITNGSGNEWNEVSALVLDNTGNIYVTGLSENNRVNTDYLTVKYNSNGSEQWTTTYNSPGDDNDQSKAIVVDNQGNVYVTGESNGINSDEDYLTIKYNSNGDTIWSARYNGPNNWVDDATAIAIDGKNNVYVTGTSECDYLTIKYNSVGVQQWIARYNGPANDNDIPNAIAVDNQGNVYVTGSSNSVGSGLNYDYATVKYDSNGIQQWVQRYNGPANGNDGAIAIAIDGEGNVYVSGSSNSADVGIIRDYATIKYNSNGVQQWVQRYDGPGNGDDGASSMTIDGLGNVYVTGCSEGDYLTIKYNTYGIEQWVTRYNNPSSAYDGAYSIAIDNTGYIYVTGVSQNDYATIKYDLQGNQIWLATYNGPGNSDDIATSIKLDSQGNVYVTGISENGYTTVKYNHNGIQQWVEYYDSQDDEIGGLAVDNAGNAYVTGPVSNDTSGEDYLTIKYIQSTGINEFPSLTAKYTLFEIYPNPAKSFFVIRLPHTTDRSQIKIFDVSGKLVKEIDYPSVHNDKVAEMRVSLDGIKNGVYFVKVENETVLKKLIVAE